MILLKRIQMLCIKKGKVDKIRKLIIFWKKMEKKATPKIVFLNLK